MSGRTEQTVPSIDNVVNRHSCQQPSWLILKCDSGHSGIWPQYPCGNLLGIRMGRRPDCRASQRLIHQMRRVGENAWPWELYIKPLVLVISRHWQRFSHSPHTHLSANVKSVVRPVWRLVRQRCFVRSWGHLLLDWAVVVSALCEIPAQRSF